MEDLPIFCRQIRARTEEHKAAVFLLSQHNLISPLIAILRQELDSMIRVIFLLSQADHEYRTLLINTAINGRKWTHKGKQSRITDRDMVDIARNLRGWTESVYTFGCSFVHLSNCHDHGSRDPFLALEMEERESLLKHMRNYHGGPPGENPTFDDLVPYLPRVFTKIADNNEYFVRQLESGDSDIEIIQNG